MSNPRFLQQQPSGYVYPWHPILAQRDDMKPYEPVMQVKEPENTRENLEATSPDPAPADPIADALAAFRKEVKKPGRKPSKPTGET